MSCIVRSYNKRNNTYYVYESTSYWDASTKTPRNHRRLIGKIDNQTGEIVPTGKRGRPRKTADAQPAITSSVTETTEMSPENASCEIARLNAALEQSEKLIAIQETKIKSLEEEVSRLSYHLKRSAPFLDSIEKSLSSLRDISKSVDQQI